jgi:hypothetical protein
MVRFQAILVLYVLSDRGAQALCGELNPVTVVLPSTLNDVPPDFVCPECRARLQEQR